MAYVYEMQFLALELPWEETLPPLLLPNFSILLYKKKKKKKMGEKYASSPRWSVESWI